jgi:cohesin complex subunit SA-1/2
MLACATRLEVEAVANPDFLKWGLDVDEIDACAEFHRDEKKKAIKAKDLNHETLSIALMKALPHLLEKFKSDSIILQSLVCLPRYFGKSAIYLWLPFSMCFSYIILFLVVPSVFSLPQRKNDFLALIKILSDIYLQTTDEVVLTNGARSIAYLCDGDHARSNDACAQVTKLVTELRDRICTHLSEREGQNSSKASSRRRSSTENHVFSIDTESALCNILDRARILSKKVDFSRFLGDDFSSLEELCQFIAEGITRRLKALQVARPIDDEETVATCKERWETIDENIVYIIPSIIRSGLAVILNSTAWRMYTSLREDGMMKESRTLNHKGYVTDSDDEDMTNVVDDHELLRLRNHLISLVELCYDQFVLDEDECSSLQVQWSNEIIEVAAQVGCDVRLLFMKEYIHAKSPLLHALAITDDSRLVGGYARFIRAKEQEVSTE